MFSGVPTFTSKTISRRVFIIRSQSLQSSSRACRGRKRARGGSVCQRGPQAETRGHGHQVRKRIGSHLAHHATAVRFHRDIANAKLATDLLVQQADDDQLHDLAFASTERRVAVAQFPQLRILA